MTVPKDYRLASQWFEDFLAEVAEETGLSTRNQAYTVVQGVLLAFRRRLSLQQAIHFAQLLPPMLRAIFVTDWDPAVPPVPFTDRALLTREVQDLRRHHNFAPETAIADVARVLRRHVEPNAFAKCLAAIGQQASDYWS